MDVLAADVVPKSEVEELKAIIVDHKANEERWQELYTDTVDKWEKAYEELEIKLENVRAEVAREIFEEIEREINDALQSNYRVLPQIEESEALWNRVNGKIDALRGIDGFIAELKKKYTEGEDESR